MLVGRQPPAAGLAFATGRPRARLPACARWQATRSPSPRFPALRSRPAADRAPAAPPPRRRSRIHQTRPFLHSFFDFVTEIPDRTRKIALLAVVRRAIKHVTWGNAKQTIARASEPVTKSTKLCRNAPRDPPSPPPGHARTKKRGLLVARRPRCLFRPTWTSSSPPGASRGRAPRRAWRR